MGDYVLVLDTGDIPDARLNAQLAAAGLPIRSVHTADEAFRALQDSPPSLILIRADDGTAVRWCQFARRLSAVPVVVISTCQEEKTTVRCLEAGADSVLAASLSRRELAARLRAVRARADCARTAPSRGGSYRVGGLVIDSKAHIAAKDGHHLPLTPTEFRLLVALARRGGDVASYQDLLTEVWDPSHDEGPRIVQLHVGSLRQKLQDDPVQPRIILNHRGLGYRLAEDMAATRVDGVSNGCPTAYQ